MKAALSVVAPMIVRDFMRANQRWQHDPSLGFVQAPEAPPLAALLRAGLALHRENYRLWHEEDRARAPGADDGVVADAKRRIDVFNRARHRALEAWDDELSRWLPHPDVDATLHSETPGSIVDRLSVASLRGHYLRATAGMRVADREFRIEGEARLAVVERQSAQLLDALVGLLRDLVTGEKRLEVYRQYKSREDARFTSGGGDLQPASVREVIVGEVAGLGR